LLRRGDTLSPRATVHVLGAQVSVSSQLREASSPLRRFIETRLPDTAGALSRFRKGLAGSDTIAQPVEELVGQYPNAEVGHAVGIRLALLFAPDIPSAASPPAVHPITQRPWPTAAELANQAEDFIERTRPDLHLLSSDDEERLCRYCYLLGLFEQYARTRSSPRLQILQISPDASAEDMLGIAPPACIRDIHELTEASREPLAALAREPIFVGPAFAGGADVGGGDGDLIAGTCLVDFKTLKDGRLDKRMMQQLAAYLLLDYDDEYRLDEVALYLARQRRLLRLPRDEFITCMAASDTSLPLLRDQLPPYLGVRRKRDDVPNIPRPDSHTRARWKARARSPRPSDGEWAQCLECGTRQGLFFLYADPELPWHS
jgi:hypothetical protein